MKTALLASLLTCLFFAALSSQNNTAKYVVIVILLTSSLLLYLGTQPSHRSSLKTRHQPRREEVNFSALYDNFEYHPMGFPETSQLIDQPTSTIQFKPQNRDTLKPAQKLKAAFEKQFAAREDQSSPIQQRREFHDDSKSVYSHTNGNATPRQARAKPKDSLYELEAKKLNDDVEKTKTLLSKICYNTFEKFYELGKEFFFNEFLHHFMKKFELTTIELNEMLKENFARKITEADIFFQNNPLDPKSNKNARSKQMPSITLQEVFAFAENLKVKQTFLWKPVTTLDQTDPEFTSKLLQRCSLVRMFYDCLSISHYGRKFRVDVSPAVIIDRLYNMNYDRRASYGTQDESMLSDYEILSLVFINSIQRAVEYEINVKMEDDRRQAKVAKTKASFNNGTLAQNIIYNMFVKVVSRDSFGLNLAQQNGANPIPSRNLYIQQTSNFSINKEPLFHFYSDAIAKRLGVTEGDCILFSPMNSNCLYTMFGYYMIHLNLLPKDIFLKLTSEKHNQTILPVLLDISQKYSFMLNV